MPRFVFSTGYAQLRPNIDSFYLLSILQERKFVTKVLDNCTGTSYPAINSTALSEIEINVTGNKEEQTAIGGFFRNLDEIIALHQRKSDGLRELKRGYLQQMFPCGGESVPRARFKGFSGEWEDKRLGEVATFSKGSGYSKSCLSYTGTPIILYGRLYTNYETIIENVDTFAEMQNNSIVSQGGEVIVPSSGETAEDIARASVVLKSGVILGGDLNIIKPISTINPIFLALGISNGNQQKELSKKAQGKSVVHIRNSDLKEAILYFPALPEQQKIGEFFRNLDEQINAQKQKIEHLQTLKKAYLQMMFV